jgi:competence ComEA-like helix-hairpin-helix protein
MYREDAMKGHSKRMPAIVTVVALLGLGCDAQGPAVAKLPAVKPPAEGSLRVNVNTATLTDLETIPGVGTSLAKLIVAGRPYTSVDELEKVSGIGPKSLKELRPYVKVDGGPEKLR